MIFVEKLISVTVSVGLPVVFSYVLVKKALTYNRETRGTNAALARRVAEDLKVDEVAAEFVIRDVIIGEDYSFLMDACALLCLLLCRAVLTPRARRFSSLPVLGR